MFDVKAIVDGLMQIKSKQCKKRGTYTSHVGFSPTLGQHWEHPYPMLDEHCGANGLCKPGITRSMPKSLQITMGTCLNTIAMMVTKVWCECNLFPDSRRQQECSTKLADHLQYKDKDELYFEAGTFAHIREVGQKLGVHVDVNNDSSDGYEYTGVVSFFVKHDKNHSRVSVIGYNRKCCREWMKRLRNCENTELHASGTQHMMELLCSDEGRKEQLRVIETAALKWLGCTEHQVADTSVDAILHAMRERGLTPSHEERPQFSCLLRKCMELFPTVQE